MSTSNLEPAALPCPKRHSEKTIWMDRVGERHMCCNCGHEWEVRLPIDKQGHLPKRLSQVYLEEYLKHTPRTSQANEGNTEVYCHDKALDAVASYAIAHQPVGTHYTEEDVHQAWLNGKAEGELQSRTELAKRDEKIKGLTQSMEFFKDQTKKAFERAHEIGDYLENLDEDETVLDKKLAYREREMARLRDKVQVLLEALHVAAFRVKSDTFGANRIETVRLIKEAVAKVNG